MFSPDALFDLLPRSEPLLYWAFILVVGLAIAYASNFLTQALLGDEDETSEEETPSDQEH